MEEDSESQVAPWRQGETLRQVGLEEAVLPASQEEASPAIAESTPEGGLIA